MAVVLHTDFGPDATGLTPTFDYFSRADSGAALLPQPTFTEKPAGSGAFEWQIDWTLYPGVTAIYWRASVTGVPAQWNTEWAPVAVTTGTPVSTGSLETLAATPLPYTSDALIASAKRNGAIPVAQATYQVSDFLAKADEEIRSYVLPLVRRTQEDFYLQSQDFPIVNGGAYRVPYRAVGGSLRAAFFVDSAGVPIDPPIPRVDPGDLEQVTFGIYFMGNSLSLIARQPLPLANALRMIYYLRPSALTVTANAARVSAFDANTRQIALANVPASYAGATSFDLVRGRPGFEMLGFDLSGFISGATATMTGALPADLMVGDYLCLPEQSPIPQIPAELHPLLAERVACAFLRTQGDKEGVEMSKAEQARLEADALVLLSQRMGSVVRKIVPRGGLWRRSGVGPWR